MDEKPEFRAKGTERHLNFPSKRKIEVLRKGKVKSISKIKKVNSYIKLNVI